jgi:universal stress protein E
MKDLTSILAVLDRSPRDTPLMSKALLLARELNARVELFSCDAEHEYALKHAFDPRGVETARQNAVADLYDYLRRLSHSVTAQNVAVTIDVVCESPLYEGIVHKVFKSCPDLVMKAAAGEQSRGRPVLDANDWQLVRTCPVPLMLSRGGAWPSRPRFAAAVDVSDEETPGLLERILRSAAYLSAGCRGELDLVFGECSGADAPNGNRTRRGYATWPGNCTSTTIEFGRSQETRLPRCLRLPPSNTPMCWCWEHSPIKRTLPRWSERSPAS